MPTAPAALGRLVEGRIGRSARVTSVRAPAPGFLEVEMDAEAPPGGWHPGHEVQFRVTPTQGRRYTVRSVSGPDARRIGLLAATAADGPGTDFLRRLRPGDRTTVLAGRHRPLRERGARRLYTGDASALGTLDALAGGGSSPTVVVEVPARAAAWVAETRPAFHVLAAAPDPGAELLRRLERELREGAFTEVDGAVLLGHAGTVQRARRTLLAAGLDRGACTVRAYWAEGKRGL
ncbi:hypothetical protein ACQYWQ_20240 [Streptomyces sp. P6-2-1]|uniref:hypothetical protein n=1 Tax=Streptomyces sp. P6-2-1 TaxID=3422591 RepID=UPI003D35D1EA